MAWDAPASVSTGDLITAATWNQDVVDNVQYLHDNRLIHLTIDRVANATTTSTTYTTAFNMIYYKSSLIDESDLSAAYFSVAHAGTDGASSFVRLHDNTGAACVVGSEVSTTATTRTWSETSDIKANLPSVDSELDVLHKTSNGAKDSTVNVAQISLEF